VILTCSHVPYVLDGAATAARPAKLVENDLRSQDPSLGS
jgi:hypothetical protein